MKKYILLLVVLASFEKPAIATKITVQGLNTFENIFRNKSFSEIIYEINSSILLDPEIPQSWAGYSAAQNIALNKTLTINEKKKAIEMIRAKSPSETVQKRIDGILKKLQKTKIYKRI
jgi:hypothetical protein